MSVAHRRGAACKLHAEKRQYKTSGAARQAIATVRKFGEHTEEDKKPIREYCCPTCGRWFITSQPQ
jgi:hypothetical protein